jgi:outer membrane protein assembly factor BamB
VLHALARAPKVVILVLLFSLPFSAFSLAAPGSDWPRFRGPDANGISPEKGINKDWQRRPPKLLWKAAMHDDGYAGPSVANGLVYILDHEGKTDVLRALRLADGGEVWRYKYEDADRPVYGYSRATPTVDAGRVYAFSRLGKLHCVEARTGKFLWSRDLIAEFKGQRPMWDLAASPLIDGRKLVVCVGGPNAAIVALDKATGKTLWHGGGSEKPAYSTPLIATIGGRRQYVTMDAEGAVGYSTENGALLWHFPWKPTDGTNVACPVIIGDSIFITASYRVGCALLDVRGGEAKARWRTDEMNAHISTPVFYGGFLYGTGDPGQLMCLDPATGRARWKQSGFEKGGIVVVDGTIIAVNGGSGDVVMVELTPERYHELGRIVPLGGQSWTSPIVAQGRLIVRNRSTLACLDLRSAP